VLDLLEHEIGRIIAATALVGYPRVEGGRVEDVRRFRQMVVPSRIHSCLGRTQDSTGCSDVIKPCEEVCA